MTTKNLLKIPRAAVEVGRTRFPSLVGRLGTAFSVADIALPTRDIKSVKPGDIDAARTLVRERKYSVVPTSVDGENFHSVFDTRHPMDSERVVVDERELAIRDFLADGTALAEALWLFAEREWYLTLRANRVSGLITYWNFNRRECRVQLYVVLSRVEELSRDLLATDGCGVDGPEKLQLSNVVLEKARERFRQNREQMGGNRFVDELDFHDVQDALRKHLPWRECLNQRMQRQLSGSEYDACYRFTELRDAVMHGRLLFPTYDTFLKRLQRIGEMTDFLGHLDAYLSRPAPPPLRKSEAGGDGLA